MYICGSSDRDSTLRSCTYVAIYLHTADWGPLRLHCGINPLASQPTSTAVSNCLVRCSLRLLRH